MSPIIYAYHDTTRLGSRPTTPLSFLFHIYISLFLHLAFGIHIYRAHSFWFLSFCIAYSRFSTSINISMDSRSRSRQVCPFMTNVCTHHSAELAAAPISMQLCGCLRYRRVIPRSMHEIRRIMLFDHCLTAASFVFTLSHNKPRHRAAWISFTTCVIL